MRGASRSWHRDLAGELEVESRREAVREAHAIAGSAGTLGLHEVSDAARGLERLLEGDVKP